MYIYLVIQYLLCYYFCIMIIRINTILVCNSMTGCFIYLFYFFFHFCCR